MESSALNVQFPMMNQDLSSWISPSSKRFFQEETEKAHHHSNQIPETLKKYLSYYGESNKTEDKSRQVSFPSILNQEGSISKNDLQLWLSRSNDQTTTSSSSTTLTNEDSRKWLSPKTTSTTCFTLSPQTSIGDYSKWIAKSVDNPTSSNDDYVNWLSPSTTSFSTSSNSSSGSSTRNTFKLVNQASKIEDWIVTTLNESFEDDEEDSSICLIDEEMSELSIEDDSSIWLMV